MNLPPPAREGVTTASQSSGATEDSDLWELHQDKSKCRTGKKQKQTKSRIYHLNWKTVRWCWSDTREAALMRARGEPGCAWPRPASSNLTVSLWGNTKCLLHDIKLIHIQKKKRKEKKKWRKRVRPAWPLLTAAVCGVRTQGYLVRYLWLVLLMSDLLWTMRRTEVNSNERSNEMLLQDVCSCFLFTAWSFFIALQRRRWNLYTCIGITALAVVNVQGFFCFCFFGRVNILRWSTTCLLSDEWKEVVNQTHLDV